MLSVFMLIVSIKSIMVNAIILNVVMPSVTEPENVLKTFENYFELTFQRLRRIVGQDSTLKFPQQVQSCWSL
jgi:hypothetical protein